MYVFTLVYTEKEENSYCHHKTTCVCGHLRTETTDFSRNSHFHMLPPVAVSSALRKPLQLAGMEWSVAAKCCVAIILSSVCSSLQFPTRYLTPASGSVLEQVVSMQYSVVSPLLSPFIYSLKNKEVKEALKRVLTRNSRLTFWPRLPCLTGRKSYGGKEEQGRARKSCHHSAVSAFISFWNGRGGFSPSSHLSSTGHTRKHDRAGDTLHKKILQASLVISTAIDFISLVFFLSFPFLHLPVCFPFVCAQNVNQLTSPLANIPLHPGKGPSCYCENQLPFCSHLKGSLEKSLYLFNNLKRNWIRCVYSYLHSSKVAP